MTKEDIKQNFHDMIENIIAIKGEDYGHLLKLNGMIRTALELVGHETRGLKNKDLIFEVLSQVFGDLISSLAVAYEIDEDEFEENLNDVERIQEIMRKQQNEATQ